MYLKRGKDDEEVRGEEVPIDEREVRGDGHCDWRVRLGSALRQHATICIAWKARRARYGPKERGFDVHVSLVTSLPANMARRTVTW